MIIASLLLLMLTLIIASLLLLMLTLISEFGSSAIDGGIPVYKYNLNNNNIIIACVSWRFGQMKGCIYGREL